MSSLLLNDKPLIILPSLAEKIGLNESIVLQQLHYWLMDSSHIRDGHKWIYNTYSSWQEQFPFWSDKTIRRTITKLENMGLIVTGNYNKLGIDKTKWYRIDYDLLDILTSPCGQNDQMDRSNCPIEEVNLTTPLPEITSENTTDIKKEVEEEAHDLEMNPFKFFEQNGFGTIGGYISQKITAWCEDLSDELVLEAMKLAVERGAKSWSYVEAILRTWAEKKIKNVDEAHALLMAFKEQQSRKRNFGKKSTRKEVIPEWFTKQKEVEIELDDDEFEREREKLLKELQEMNLKPKDSG